MAFALLTVGYFLTHFALYAFWLRNLKAFWTEKGVFLYHAVPAGCSTGSGALMSILAPELIGSAHIVLFASVHVIYSISLLELWALADGGYSLSILDCLDSNHELTEEVLLQELAKLGTMKKQNRIADLLRLGLIQARDDYYSLTPRGKRVARIIATIVHIANVPVGR